MIKIISIVLLGFLFITFPVYAIESPTLVSPANNSTISSIPTFSWQAVSDSTGYNILIDDEPTVTSPYAKTPYYPTNPSYSPQTLNPGTYYWKVKAKDSDGNWGSFSNIWSFTLSTSTPSSTPTATSNPTPTPSSSSTLSTSSFTISNMPSQINSDQSFNVLISLSLPNSPGTVFYLKGAFKKADGSNYFGYTKVSGDWVKNGSSYSSQYSLTTDSSGNWSGNLEVEPDSNDSGFTGTDNYIFKVGRYTSSGSGPTWSNEETLKIIGSAVSDSSESSSNSSATPSPSNSPTVKTASITSSKSTKTNTEIASVAGEATISAENSASPSATPEFKGSKINFLSIIGIILVIIGLIPISYAIYNKFRKRNQRFG